MSEGAGNAKKTLSEKLEEADKVARSLIQTSTDFASASIGFTSSFPKSALKEVREVKSLLQKKIESTTEEFNESLVLIEEAGFELMSVSIDVGAIPKLIPCFNLVREITQVEKEAVIQKANSNRMTRTLLDSLFKTQFLSKVKIGNLRFHQIEVHIGAIPKVQVSFTK